MRKSFKFMLMVESPDDGGNICSLLSSIKERSAALNVCIYCEVIESLCLFSATTARGKSNAIAFDFLLASARAIFTVFLWAFVCSLFQF